MKKIWLYPILLLASLILMYPSACASDDVSINQVHFLTMKELEYDYKSGLLFTFFNKYRCPVNYHITPYLNAADKYGIDWRLLPAVSIQESSCGKHQLYNNWWGYGSAASLKKFKTVDEGIDYVVGQIKNNRVYSNKSVPNILKTYGPHSNPGYYKQILKLMGEISPKE